MLPGQLDGCRNKYLATLKFNLRRNVRPCVARAAVDDDLRARDMSRRGRRKEQRHASHVLRLAEASCSSVSNRRHTNKADATCRLSMGEHLLAGALETERGHFAGEEAAGRSEMR